MTVVNASHSNSMNDAIFQALVVNAGNVNQQHFKYLNLTLSSPPSTNFTYLERFKWFSCLFQKLKNNNKIGLLL